MLLIIIQSKLNKIEEVIESNEDLKKRLGDVLNKLKKQKRDMEDLKGTFVLIHNMLPLNKVWQHVTENYWLSKVQAMHNITN